MVLLFVVLAGLLSAASGYADMKIILKDGKVIDVPVAREQVKSIEYTDAIASDEGKVFGEQTIRIQSAKYGNVSFELGNELGYKQYFCNAKAPLVEKCDGKTNCKVIVGSQICGDPYPGKGKYLYVEYTCGDKLKRAKNTQTEVMRLKCP